MVEGALVIHERAFWNTFPPCEAISENAEFFMDRNFFFLGTVRGWLDKRLTTNGLSRIGLTISVLKRTPLPPIRLVYNTKWGYEFIIEGQKHGKFS